MREAERFFILQQIDTLRREHLQAMDALRESVGLRGYGQKDPLIEYKNEGYDMFLEMMTNMRRNVIYSMFMFQPAVPRRRRRPDGVPPLGVAFGWRAWRCKAFRHSALLDLRPVQKPHVQPREVSSMEAIWRSSSQL